MVKIRKPNSTSTVTTQISANSKAEAEADAKRRYPGCVIVSCNLK